MFAAQFFSPDHPDQFHTPDLTGTGERKRVQEADQVGGLIVGQRELAPLNNLFPCDNRAFHWNDAGAQGLSQNIIWNPHDRSFLCGRMGENSFLNFPGMHAETTA